MDNEKWWKRLKPFRPAPNWKIMWNKLEDIEPDNVAPDDKAWLFTFVEDMTYLVTEHTYRQNHQTIKHTFAIDLGWYPEGDINGNYYLIAVLDDDWQNPICELKTRSTQEVIDTIELWMFERFADWEAKYIR